MYIYVRRRNEKRGKKFRFMFLRGSLLLGVRKRVCGFLPKREK
jgi:hypothetical protein